jgi:hypothetical protein
VATWGLPPITATLVANERQPPTNAVANTSAPVETPIKLTEHQRKLLKELDESFRKSGERRSPNSKTWTDRVKDLFKYAGRLSAQGAIQRRSMSVRPRPSAVVPLAELRAPAVEVYSDRP